MGRVGMLPEECGHVGSLCLLRAIVRELLVARWHVREVVLGYRAPQRLARLTAALLQDDLRTVLHELF